MRTTMGGGVAVLASAMLCLLGGEAAAGPNCKTAADEERVAQRQLSEAVRRADAAAAAYVGCIRGQHDSGPPACAAQKTAHVVATKHKEQAGAAYRFARARRVQACR
ncbi:MAG: hypothetical protein HY744_07745 [Deltaproteobacteria bacterium]|nr:hypothetical protein [Deltaproteobacteria bacterium]